MNTGKSPLLYSNTAVYQLLMRVLYGPHFRARYDAVSHEIEAGTSVVDVCAGDCFLYRHRLRHMRVQYTALDISKPFVRIARKRGIDAREFDLNADALPRADFVIMQGSLYHFMPDAAGVVHKMIAASKQKVIVAEPVRNLSDSSNPFIAAVSRRFTKPASARADFTGDRFNQQTLTDLFQTIPAHQRSFLIPGGRELVGIFAGAAK